jgi:hypothetical protein
MTGKDQQDAVNRKRAARSDEAERLAREVLENWLSGNPPLTAKDLAKHLDVPESKIRSLIDLHSGAVPGTSATRIEVQKFSKDYPMMGAGYTRAWAYVPSDDATRAEIFRLRHALAELGVGS